MSPERRSLNVSCRCVVCVRFWARSALQFALQALKIVTIWQILHVHPLFGLYCIVCYKSVLAPSLHPRRLTWRDPTSSHACVASRIMPLGWDSAGAVLGSVSVRSVAPAERLHCQSGGAARLCLSQTDSALRCACFLQKGAQGPRTL